MNKLGLVLVNQKMKLQMEIKHLEKSLDTSKYSFLDKIKYFFQKRNYKKLNKELKEKKVYLKFITKYIEEKKDKMDMIISDDLVKILNKKNFNESKEILKKL